MRYDSFRRRNCSKYRTYPPPHKKWHFSPPSPPQSCFLLVQKQSFISLPFLLSFTLISPINIFFLFYLIVVFLIFKIFFSFYFLFYILNQVWFVRFLSNLTFLSSLVSCVSLSSLRQFTPPPFCFNHYIKLINIEGYVKTSN